MYPKVGPARIRGAFHPDLIDQFKDALGKVATVYGTLSCWGEDTQPSRITAASIELRDGNQSLDLLALRGAFPVLTGELTTQEFITKVRNDDWPD